MRAKRSGEHVAATRPAPTRTGATGATPRSPAAPKGATGGRVLEQAALQTLVGYHLRRAEVHMRQLVIKLLSEWDIRPPEYSALSLIACNDLVTQSDLGLALNIKRPNMVTLIEKLEKRGLIKREVHARDRRNQIITLTEKGEAQLADIDGLLHDMDKQWTGCWTAKERAQVSELLQRLYKS